MGAASTARSWSVVKEHLWIGVTATRQDPRRSAASVVLAHGDTDLGDDVAGAEARGKRQRH